MNKGLLWRGGTAQVIFALLLLVGVALGWRAHQTREQTIDRTARLAALKDRICSSVLQVGDGIQAMLLDAKSDPGRKRCHEAQSDLAKAIDSLQFEFPKEAELLSTAKNLHALHGGIVDQAESDASGAMSIYRKNYLLIQDQRGELLNKLNQQAEQFSAAAWAQAKAGDLVLIVGVGFVLVLGLLMAWWQSAAMSKSLAGLAGTLDYMRRGDFTRRVAVDGPGPFSVVGEGLNRLAEDLSALVSQVQTAGLQVNSTATRIAATVREQQGTASEIADSTAEIEATSKQISTTSRELVKTIDEVSQVAKETAQLANSGQTGIARMEATMRHIMEASGAISSKLAVLSEKNANINTVVTTIAKVADQTNLLSLNAAIEAEKAGEYGLGFAVVAMEIRRLADQTAVATFDIEKTVKEMQTAVAGGVMGMDKFTDEVRRGVEEIRQVSTQLGQIIHQVQILTSRFQNVNEGMHGQALGAQEISQTLAELSKAAQQTADSLHQSNLAIEHLNAAVQGLQTSVVRLKLED